MSLFLKYTIAGQERHIVIPHITYVLYDDQLNQVQIELTSGTIVAIPALTETAYEDIMKKIKEYYLDQKQ